MNVKYSTSIDNVSTVFNIEPRRNHLEYRLAGKRRHLTVRRKRRPCETRVEVRGRLVHLQSAFEDCQLGALHSSPRNGLLFVLLFAITFNNRPLSHDRKVIITRDVCSGQPPLSEGRETQGLDIYEKKLCAIFMDEIVLHACYLQRWKFVSSPTHDHTHFHFLSPRSCDHIAYENVLSEYGRTVDV